MDTTPPPPTTMFGQLYAAQLDDDLAAGRRAASALFDAAVASGDPAEVESALHIYSAAFPEDAEVQRDAMYRRLIDAAVDDLARPEVLDLDEYIDATCAHVPVEEFRRALCLAYLDRHGQPPPCEQVTLSDGRQVSREIFTLGDRELADDVLSAMRGHRD